MKTLKAVILLAAVAMAESANAKSPIQVRCENVFATSTSTELKELSKTTFPSGYGLNATDTTIALGLPQTRELTKALAEATQVIESIVKSQHSLAIIFHPTNQFPAIDGALERGAAYQRNFPQAFYQAHLASRSASETSIRKRYERILRIFDHMKIDQPTDEALAFLAYATRSFDNSSGANPLPTSVSDRIRNEAIASVLLRYNREKRLPLLSEFVNTTDRLFIEFAIMNRRGNIVHDPKLAQQTSLLNDEHYRAKLEAILSRTPGLSLQEKIHIAIQQLEPEFAKSTNNAFTWLQASRQQARNLEKWQNAGLFFASNLIGTTMVKLGSVHNQILAQGQALHESSFDDEIKAAIAEMTGKDRPKEHAFLFEMLVAVASKLASLANADETKIHHLMNNELKAFSLAIKDQVTEQMRLEQKLAAEKLRAAIAASPQPTILSGRFKSSILENQGPSLGRAAQRALKATADQPATYEGRNGAGTEASPQSVSPVASTETQKPSEPGLANLTLETAIPGQKYWFDQFGRAIVQASGQASIRANNQMNHAELNDRRVQYVELSKKVIDQLKDKRQDLQSWVATFLIGRVASQHASGLKLLRGGRDNVRLWEIKDKKSCFRMIIEQDKASRTWSWVDFTHHGRVDCALRNY